MINGKHGQGTHKMGSDKSAENTPKCPKTYLPKLSAQAQKFRWKKASLGVHSLCICASVFFKKALG